MTEGAPRTLQINRRSLPRAFLDLFHYGSWLLVEGAWTCRIEPRQLRSLHSYFGIFLSSHPILAPRLMCQAKS